MKMVKKGPGLQFQIQFAIQITAYILKAGNFKIE